MTDIRAFLKKLDGIDVLVQSIPVNPQVPLVTSGISHWRVTISGRKLRGHDGRKRASADFYISTPHLGNRMPMVDEIFLLLGGEATLADLDSVATAIGISPTISNLRWEEEAMKRFKRTRRDLEFVLHHQFVEFMDLFLGMELGNLEFVELSSSVKLGGGLTF